MRTPPLLDDFIHSKVCKLICEILLTLPTTLTLSRRSVITEIFSKARKIKRQGLLPFFQDSVLQRYSAVCKPQTMSV